MERRGEKKTVKSRQREMSERRVYSSKQQALQVQVQLLWCIYFRSTRTEWVEGQLVSRHFLVNVLCRAGRPSCCPPPPSFLVSRRNRIQHRIMMVHAIRAIGTTGLLHTLLNMYLRCSFQVTWTTRNNKSDLQKNLFSDGVTISNFNVNIVFWLLSRFLIQKVQICNFFL